MRPCISGMLLLLGTLLAGDATAQTGAVAGVLSVERGHAAGAVVFLVPSGEVRYPPAADPVVIDQVNLRFIPQVVAVLPGETVDFPNSDPVLHNVFSPRGPGDGFNLGTYPPSETRSRRFTEPGVHVILCHVHPEMLAYVVVVPAPYHAVVNADGGFTIDAVPPGSYTLRAWHGRRPTLEREVVIARGATAHVELHLQR